MRCLCCNRLLNDYESTVRHSDTGEFLDTCMRCLDGLNIPYKGREDLNPFEEDDIDLESYYEYTEGLEDE